MSVDVEDTGGNNMSEHDDIIAILESNGTDTDATDEENERDNKLIFATQFAKPVKFAFVNFDQPRLEKYTKIVEKHGGVVEPSGDYKNVIHLADKETYNSHHIVFDTRYLKQCIRLKRILDPCQYVLKTKHNMFQIEGCQKSYNLTKKRECIFFRALQSQPQCRCKRWLNTQKELSSIAKKIRLHSNRSEDNVASTSGKK